MKNIKFYYGVASWEVAYGDKENKDSYRDVEVDKMVRLAWGTDFEKVNLNFVPQDPVVLEERNAVVD